MTVPPPHTLFHHGNNLLATIDLHSFLQSDASTAILCDPNRADSTPPTLGHYEAIQKYQLSKPLGGR